MRIDVAAIEGGVEVTMTDYGVAPFDVTRAPDADIDAPVERARARRAGASPDAQAGGLAELRLRRTTPREPDDVSRHRERARRRSADAG